MKNNFFFYMFYNNMYETSSKLNEILVLNRQLRNYLSMKGGAKKDLFDFKEQLNKHRYYIFYLFSTCFVTIIYLSFSMMPKNKKFIGGDASIGDNIKDKVNDFYLSMSETFSELFGKLSEFISDEYDKVSDVVSDEYDKISGQIFENLDNAIGPVIEGTNTTIRVVKSTISNVLWTMPIGGFLPPVIPLLILIALITYGVCNFILDRKLYLPCWGCQDGNIVFRCMPGTGKGSISCTVYTEFLNTIKLILKQFQFIVDLVNILKDAIKKAINSILYLTEHITGWVTEAFSQSIGKIFDALKFLTKLNIPDNWGFNFGEFLICPDFSTKGDDCIYYKDGSLRDSHGNNPLLNVFWKMIRVILEVPPPIPKFPFGGGMKLKLNKFKKPTIKEPKIKKHKINTTTKSHSKKPPFNKDIVYENLLKVLIKIEINPIKWIAAVWNLLVDAINLIIDGILTGLKKIMEFIFLLITEAAKAITGALGKIFNALLVPIDEVISIATKIPKMIYKSIKDIFDVGIFAIIGHAFYSAFTKIPFLKDIKSFMVLITLVIIVMSILIFCPMIGAYYSFFKPYDYIKTNINAIIDQVKYTFKNAKNFKKSITNFIDSLEFADELNDQLKNMKDSYKYVTGVVIVIIVIFIILNMFTNVNRFFLKFIRDLLYNHYKGKYNDINKKFASFKLNKIINESNEMKGFTENYNTIMKIRKEEKEKDKKNKISDDSFILNRIDNIKNLGINQLKSFT